LCGGPISKRKREKMTERKNSGQQDFRRYGSKAGKTVSENAGAKKILATKKSRDEAWGEILTHPNPQKKNKQRIERGGGDWQCLKGTVIALKNADKGDKRRKFRVGAGSWKNRRKRTFGGKISRGPVHVITLVFWGKGCT